MNPTLTLKQRLTLWAKSSYGSLKEVARLTGLNYEHLTQLDDSKLPSGRILLPLAELGLNIDWLLTSRGMMTYSEGADPPPIEKARSRKSYSDLQIRPGDTFRIGNLEFGLTYLGPTDKPGDSAKPEENK